MLFSRFSIENIDTRSQAYDEVYYGLSTILLTSGAVKEKGQRLGRLFGKLHKLVALGSRIKPRRERFEKADRIVNRTA